MKKQICTDCIKESESKQNQQGALISICNECTLKDIAEYLEEQRRYKILSEEINKTSEKINEAVSNIRKNHYQIIDDWCKAYLAHLYKSGMEINPGCFVLNEQNIFENNQMTYKYWFSLKDKDYQLNEKF